MVLGGSYLCGCKNLQFEKGILVMGVKVSDIMLELATGDASVHDAYIQEAMGQVKVSAAIYNAAKQIAMLDDEDREDIVQECAEAGLPSDREGALALVYEAVEHEIIGTCRHLYSESAKIDEVASKETAPLKAISALAKACGVKTNMNGSKEYAAELATAVIKNKDINLKGGARFCKASSAKRLTKNFIQAASLLCNAFCIDTSALFEDDTISTVVSAPVSSKPRKNSNGETECSLDYVVSTIGNAGEYLKNPTLEESDYTTSISKNDIATVITCNFAAAKVAKFIKNKLGKDGGKVEKLVKAVVKKSVKKNGITSAAETLGSTVAEINHNLFQLSKNIIKAYNDSISALMESQN